MSTIRVRCPSCRELLELDAHHAGQEVECGSCFTVFVAKAALSLRDEDEEPPRRRSYRDDDYEEDDYPRRRPVRRRPGSSGSGGGGGSNAAATISLVLGIVSLPLICCCWFVSMPISFGAIISGFFGLKSESGRGMAIAGIICGLISLLLTIGLLIAGLGMNGINNGPFGGIGR